MANTTNYSIPLPQLGEPADIRVLDQGTEMIDGIMHGNRTMIAPGWVSTETYNTGSRVVYLGEYYKCKADNVTGAWDATKWDKTTVGEDIEGLGTGGASALADLDDVEITSPADGQALLYDDSDDKWKNQNLPDVSVTKEASGNPIEITDAADAPIVKCVTEIQGSQDLHGYDKPWPPGAGKNLYKPTKRTTTASNVTYSVDDDGKITLNGLADSNNSFTLFLSSNVTVSDYYTVSIYGNTSATLNVNTLYLNAGDSLGLIAIKIESGVNYNDSFYIQVERGQTATSYAPYSNICPITAYTEGEIEVSDGDGNTTTHTTTYPSAIYRGSEDCVDGEVETVKIKLSKKWSEGTSETVIGDYTRKVFTLPYKAVSNDPNAICNVAPRILNYTSDELHFYVATTTALVFLPNGTDGNTDIEISYELATPTTFSVTPTNLPIKSLSGYNHIESSTGDMEIEYIRNTYQPLVDLIQSGNGHTYSTQEQVVGKWIDGSTVYEKTISTSSPSTANTNVAIADLSSCSINTLISIEGVMYVSSLSQHVPIFWSYNTSLMGAVYVDGTNLMQIVPNGYTGATEAITIRYTKTTTRSLSAPQTSQKAPQIEPLTEKEEEVPTDTEKTVEEPEKEEPAEMPETEEETDER